MKTDNLHTPATFSSDFGHLPESSYSVKEKTPPANNKSAKITNGYLLLVLTITILELIIVLLLTLGIYITIHQQHALNQIQQTQCQQHKKVLSEQEQVLNTLLLQQDVQKHKLEDLQNKLMAITGSNINTWLLSQADFLVKTAERKLWSDRDVITAGALLRSADASLAKMNDSTLIEARRAITEDIEKLAEIKQISFDDIIFKLNQLTNQIDNLCITNNDNNKAPISIDDGKLLGSIQEWRKNLKKSWHNFLNEFITVRRRTRSSEPFPLLDRGLYLRESIRAQLLIAAQAVQRYQNRIYQQSLNSVSNWVRAYFNTNEDNIKDFLNQLNALSQEDIIMNLPDRLKSQLLLDKLTQARVQSLLNNPEISIKQVG